MSLQTHFQQAHRYILPLGLSMAFLFLAHLSAMYFNAYELYPPVDIPMHILGGVSVAFLSLYLVSLFHPSLTRRKIALAALAGALLFGLLWEGFEWGADVLTGAGEYTDYLDALGDLVNDVVGGSVVSFWYARRK